MVVNGVVARSIKAQAARTERGGYEVRATPACELETSGWIAVRAYESRPDGRPRFAHTAPVYIDLPGKPLVANKADVAYLVTRVEDELKRHTGVLEEGALEEYRAAAKVYRSVPAK